ncbi:MAG: peptidase S10 [Opitutaceae bacterium]|jgi:carboxypeptidase C (cathepsin A)
MAPFIRWLIVNIGLGAACVLTAVAQESSPAKGETPPKSEADVATAPVKEARVVTHHKVTVDGATIDYDAVAGTLTLRDDQGKPEASMFYVAYVVDRGAGDSRRPITFFYNGGPGSPSIWLHLGSFGPVRVVTDAPEATPGAPFKLEANSGTLLGKTDMVFLDEIGTGYSRSLGDAKDEKFWGVDSDIDSFAQAITRYLTLNNRWNSPKFLFGESYGTTRSAGLVFALQKQGVQFNGVTLLSSILNFGVADSGFDRAYVSYLPSYAAAAWYHGKINPKPDDLGKFLGEVRAYAGGPYLLALDQGQNLSAADEDAVARQLSVYTGLSAEFLKENRLRVTPDRFRKELLRDQHRTIGRYDSRFLGIDADDGGEGPEFDPAAVYTSGPIVAGYHDYISTQLNYHGELNYRLKAIDLFKKWDWHHRPPGSSEPEQQADVALDLAAALRANPHLQLLSLNGWYDMATPFFQTEYDISHMYLDPSLRDHVHFAYYPSGHMVYLDPAALKQMKADVEHFYDEAAPPTP